MATKRLSHGEKIHSNEDAAPTFSTDKEHTALAHICSMSKSSSGGSSEEKGADIHATPAFDVESGEKKKEQLPVSTAEELVTNILHVDDDPTLNPWTFRMWFIGEFIYTDTLMREQSSQSELTTARYRPLCLWRHPRNDLLFQAADPFRLRHIPDHPWLHSWRNHGKSHPEVWLDWALLQSAQV